MADADARVLLVDDDKTVLTTLGLALEAEGVAYDTAATAEEGLAMLRTGSYHLLVADKNLPDMSGLEMVREARTVWPGIRVLLMTGYASLDSALESLHIGVDGFLEKPFEDIFEVVGRIREVLEKPPRADGKVAASAAASHFSKATQMLQAATEAQSRSVRIVIANPIAAERDWLRQRLRATTEEISMHVSTAETLIAVDSSPPDLLLIDADLDGDDFLATLEQIRQCCPETIVVVTAIRPSLTAVIKLIDLGVRAVFDKPFDDRGFASKVGPALEAAREARMAVEVG